MADETAVPGQVYGLIGRETTWGTAVTADKDIGLIQSFSPSENRSLADIDGIGQVNINELVPMNYESNASIEMKLQHGRILEYIFGSVAHAQSTNDYTHTFSEADTLPFFTYEDGYNGTTDNVIKFAGGFFKSATIKLDLNGVLLLSGDIGFKCPTTNTTASAIVVSTLPVLPFSWASLKTGADGAEVTNTMVKSFSVTIEEGYEKIFGYGSQLPVAAARTGHRKYSFEFSMVFKNQVDYKLFLGGGTAPTATGGASVPSIIFNANNGVSLGSGRREFNIDFSTASYEAHDKPSTFGDAIIQTFKGKAKSITSNQTYFVDSVTTALWG